jgi:hypothetical protein
MRGTAAAALAHTGGSSYGVSMAFICSSHLLPIKYSKLDCGDEKNKVKHKFLNDFLLLFEVLLAPMRQDPVPTPNK